MTLDDISEEERRSLIEALTLELLYLTSREEDGRTLSWKTHDWEAMDALALKGDIVPPRCRRTHARELTSEGIRKARTLLSKTLPLIR